MDVLQKKGRGRPRKQEKTVKLVFRIEEDIYDWILDNKGEKSINQFMNDLIRERAGL